MVGVDNIAGAVLATPHLLEHGHRTVHHISGPVGLPEARERRAGWREALAAGAPVPRRAGRRLERPVRIRTGPAAGPRPEVTAVFCGNDQMALGLLRALSEVGRGCRAR